MPLNNSDEARLFFALWPEITAQQELHSLATKFEPLCRARVMDADMLHITLLFLGKVERTRLPQLIQTADKVSVPAFGFKLEKLSFWSQNRIAYAALLAEMPALNQLVTMLKQQLAAVGFLFENNEFIPHVTLLRQVENILESQTITPIDWWADSFVLAESIVTEQGANYQIIQKWPLSAITRC